MESDKFMLASDGLRIDVYRSVDHTSISRHDTKVISGANEGVIDKLRQHLNTDYLDSSPCVAHSFALVGSGASLRVKRNRTI